MIDRNQQLFDAVRHNNLESAHEALNNGADIHYSWHATNPVNNNQCRYPILFFAKSVEMLQLLLHYGADVNQTELGTGTLLAYLYRCAKASDLYSSDLQFLMMKALLRMQPCPISNKTINYLYTCIMAKAGTSTGLEHVLCPLLVNASTDLQEQQLFNREEISDPFCSLYSSPFLLTCEIFSVRESSRQQYSSSGVVSLLKNNIILWENVKHKPVSLSDRRWVDKRILEVVNSCHPLKPFSFCIDLLQLYHLSAEGNGLKIFPREIMMVILSFVFLRIPTDANFESGFNYIRENRKHAKEVNDFKIIYPLLDKHVKGRHTFCDDYQHLSASSFFKVAAKKALLEKDGLTAKIKSHLDEHGKDIASDQSVNALADYCMGNKALLGFSSREEIKNDIRATLGKR